VTRAWTVPVALTVLAMAVGAAIGAGEDPLRNEDVVRQWVEGVAPDRIVETIAASPTDFDLAPEMPEVDWNEALEHLPLVDMMEEVDGPEGIYSEFVQRRPDDPAWYQGGLYHDNEPWGVPALWLNSWYDVSIGPNIALFRHATENGVDAETRDNQYMIIAPVPQPNSKMAAFLGRISRM